MIDALAKNLLFETDNKIKWNKTQLYFRTPDPKINEGAM
jgi:hypothetical protein